MKTTLGLRRNRYLAIISIFSILAALITGMVGCGGSSVSEDLEIQTWYDLDAVRNNLAGHHRLMNDLDSSTAGYDELASPTANGGKGWEPIEYSLWGTFDGQGYAIRDLFINRPDENSTGLFQHIYGVIKNVGVCNSTVTGADTVGGLVATNMGTISDSYFVGNLSGQCGAGGLTGLNYQWGTVTNSYYNYDRVLINGEKVITIGALFGEDFNEWLANDKSLDINERLSKEDSYYIVNNVTDFEELLAFGQDASLKFRLESDLDLATEPNFYIPYLAGEFDGNDYKISNLSFGFGFVSAVGLFGCLVSGANVTDTSVENVDISADKYAGALVGFNCGGIITRSCSTGTVIGSTEVGGLIGRSLSGAVSFCYSSANVNGDDSVGGLLGNSWGTTMEDCYSKGNVAGNSYVGGLVGYNYEGNIVDSYSTGTVAGSDFAGGLLGYNSAATVRNSFWDTQTSGQAISYGGIGRTTAEMKDITTFSDAGWIIVAVNYSSTNPMYIWNIVNNVTYPFLSWEPVS